MLSDQVLIALIVGAPGIVTSLLAVLNHFRVSKVAKNVVTTHDKIDELEKNTNGKIEELIRTKDKLLEVSKLAEFAKGLQEGKAIVEFTNENIVKVEKLNEE